MALSSVLDFKKGYKTTEFWLALVPAVVIVLALFGVDVTPDEISNVIVAVAGGVSAAYSLGRSILKGKRVEAVARLHEAEAYRASYSANAVPGAVE